MDWLYYHDVMTRFTLRHWHGDVIPSPSTLWREVYILQPPALSLRRSCISHQPSSASALPELLSEFCEALPGPSSEIATKEGLEDHKGFLRILDWRTRTVPVFLEPDENPEMATIIELYRLAILVYINRVSENLLDQAARIQRYIDQAFALFSQLTSCERQFPIFILGCEARTDDQRATIMGLISRTENKISSRSFNHITLLLHAVWAQDDLADGELNYSRKLTSIISLCNIAPSLV